MITIQNVLKVKYLVTVNKRDIRINYLNEQLWFRNKVMILLFS